MSCILHALFKGVFLLAVVVAIESLYICTSKKKKVYIDLWGKKYRVKMLLFVTSVNSSHGLLVKQARDIILL